MLIRLHEYAGWSAFLLSAYGINRFSHNVAHITVDDKISQQFFLFAAYINIFCIILGSKSIIMSFSFRHFLIQRNVDSMTTLVTQQQMLGRANGAGRAMGSTGSNHLKASLVVVGDSSSSSILTILEEDLVVGSLWLINTGLIWGLCFLNLMKFMSPTLKKLTGHIGFGLCMHASVRACIRSSRTMHARVLKFHRWIPHGKIADTRLFLVRVISLSGVTPLWKNQNEIWCMPYLMNYAC